MGFGRVFVTLFIWLLAVQAGADSSTDQYIKDLKSTDPEIRSNAAFELGCS
jgi:hypothetical protein